MWYLAYYMLFNTHCVQQNETRQICAAICAANDIKTANMRNISIASPFKSKRIFFIGKLILVNLRFERDKCLR